MQHLSTLLNFSYIFLGLHFSVFQNTAKAWLSLLETSYIIVLLYPYYKNFGKRLIKAPKLYFIDTGIACSLLRIPSSDELVGHYLRGELFESLIISDYSNSNTILKCNQVFICGEIKTKMK